MNQNYDIFNVSHLKQGHVCSFKTQIEGRTCMIS